MVDPSSIANAFGGVFSGIFPKLVYWFGIIIYSSIGIGIVYLGYLWMTFKYKITIFERRGDGSGNFHSVGRVVNDRAKLVKVNGVDKWRLFWARKNIEPIDLSNVYGNNRVFLYKAGMNNYVPTRFACGNPNAAFVPLENDVKFWEQLEVQQAMVDYQDKDWWTKYGNQFALVMTVIFCCILVGATIYFTYNYATGGTNAMNDLAGSIRSLNVIEGIAPR